MIFFNGIFGYLVFTIFYKWGTDWVADAEPAPSLLNLLILMFMSPTAPIDEPLYGHECFTNCGDALAADACGVSTISAACPISCNAPSLVNFVDTLQPYGSAGGE